MAIPPIIANQKGDVLIFERLEEAESYVEAIDVLNDEYSIFDSRGLLLVPRVMDDGIRVRFFDSDPPDERPDELVDVLRRTLGELGEEKTGLQEDEVWRMPLEDLVACRQVIEARHRKRRRWPWHRK